MPRQSPSNRRTPLDRRQKDRRQSRRRLRTVPVALERRKGGDRRGGNRRGGVRRAVDTFSAKKKIFARARRAR